MKRKKSNILIIASTLFVNFYLTDVRRICALLYLSVFMFRSQEIWTPRKPWVNTCIRFAYICYSLLLFQEHSVISVCVEYLTKLSLTCNEQTGRKTWLLKQFYYFFTPSDLTWHDATAFGRRVIISGQVRRCKKLVRQREEPVFPATSKHALCTKPT